MSLAVTILGCGSSGGVPRIGPDWGACDPENPKNRRRRCSILITRRSEGGGETRVLVDTSPDLREQLLAADIGTLDAVIITHEHADHTHGIDDLRPIALRMRRRVPVYMDRRTSDLLHARFAYCFATPPGSSYPPILDAHGMRPGEPIVIDGDGGTIQILPFDLDHGDIQALGLRFDDVAYTPDVSGIPEDSLPALTGLDLWIVDALRPRPHPSHFTLEEALAWIERMGPRRAVLTNMHVDLDYETLRRSLPRGIEPAFDGMTLPST